MSIKARLRHILKTSLPIDIDEKNIVIEIPKDRKNGDYCTNIALLVAKRENMTPVDAANMIKDKIDSEGSFKVEVDNSGYIYFFLDKEFLFNNVNKIIEQGKNYGRSNYGKNKKIIIEYISDNCMSCLSIEHGVIAVYCDCLSRIMSYAGYDVTREYFLGDIDDKISNFCSLIKDKYREECGFDYNKRFNDGYYDNIESIASSIYDKYGDSKFDEEIDFFKREVIDVLLEDIKKNLDMIRVNFDLFTNMQSLFDDGIVDKTLYELQKNDKCYIEDNALCLKKSDLNDGKDLVLIKSDGNYTYLLSDIVHHIDRLNKGYDKIIGVYDLNYYEYIERLKSSIDCAGYDSNKIDIKVFQNVNILEYGEKITLNSDSNNCIMMNEVLEKIETNAIRYLFASSCFESQLNINFDLAKENGINNPVYYIEKANTIIYSILRGKKYETREWSSTIDNSIAYIMLNKLMEFEDVVVEASTMKAPQIICNYLYEVASLFYDYYNSEGVINDNNNDYTNESLLVLEATFIVMNNAANLIGLILREEM